MSVSTGSSETTAPGTADPRAARRLGSLRRAGFVTFVLLVAQFILGSYVSVFVTVPKADHGQGAAQALANGPVGLTVHIVLGLLLILAAIGFLAQSIVSRRKAVIVAAVLGLLAMIGAAGSGSAFTGNGQNAASMTMAALAGVGLLCYGTALFLLPNPESKS